MNTGIRDLWRQTGLSPLPIGEVGREAFEIELARFPGVRRAWSARQHGPAFTFFGEAWTAHSVEHLMHGEIPTVPGPQSEMLLSQYQAAYYEFVSAYLRRSESACLLLQCEYWRFDRELDGRIALGRDERVIIVEHPDTTAEDGYGKELWTFVSGATTYEDIYYTRTSASLHPRPFGALCTFDAPIGAERVIYKPLEEIAVKSEFLVLDAFDGSWLIFAELS